MTSTIAWLDATPEEQRVARELVSLFSQPEGRDELGIGQIRDALSDLLFPGTSVIQTRARYFLFVPWCYTAGAAAAARGEQNARKGREQERRLIKTLLDAHLDDPAGLIGSRVGPGVKTLPSAIYWSGLQRYGILTHETDPERLGLLAPGPSDAATELSHRIVSDWHPGLPKAPPDFPYQVPGGFEMQPEEAGWLSVRMTTAGPHTVLAALLERRELLASFSHFPWDELPRSDFEPLDHAYWFSNLFHGASLLYNLMVAERYESDSRLTRLEGRVDHYQQRITDWWASFVEPQRERIARWDTRRLWELTLRENPNINTRTRQFVDSWIHGVLGTSSSRFTSDGALRALVRGREQRKGKRSRLLNDRMLASWSGASGAAQLDFRWGTVRSLVNDVIGGVGERART